MAEKSLPNEDWAIGMLVSPFQYAVHEPALAVWQERHRQEFAPDSWDSVDGLPPEVS